MQNTVIEVWENIDGFDGYQVSSFGRIKSLRGTSERLMTLQRDTGGGLIVGLTSKGSGVPQFRKVSRLVAEAFVENPENYNFLEFIDGDPENCRADNLAWVSLTSKMQNQYKKQCKRIHQYTVDGEYVRTWDNIGEATASVGGATLTEACKHNGKTAGGFQWRYAKDGEEPPRKIEKAVLKEKPIIQYDTNGIFISEYASVSEAGNAVGTANFGNITNCCKGKRKTAYGYVWRYAV